LRKLLIVYAGCTHAEKSTAAIQAAGRMKRLGRRVALIRPVQSIRPDPDNPAKGDRLGTLVTKRGEEWPSIDLELAADIVTAFRASGADMLWLDEPGLWLEDDQLVIPAVRRLRRHVDVMVSTIVADSEGEPFRTAPPWLWAAADVPAWRKADCDLCAGFGIATRSIYIGNQPKDGQVKVGGVSDYAASCPNCDIRRARAAAATT
jgi:thymidine kinase